MLVLETIKANADKFVHVEASGFVTGNMKRGCASYEMRTL
jgi:hypothetical protein